MVDKAETTLSRVMIEGRWKVRRRATSLLAKLTETRNKAYATVGLIQSDIDGPSKATAWEQYVPLHGELVKALAKYEKAASR